MRVLVSGGSGFLGRHVVWRLAELGHEVVFTGRNEEAAAVVIRHAVRPVAFVALEHGSAEASRILHRVGSVQAVVHCAALSSPWGPRAHFQQANVDSTRQLLNMATDRGLKRFVHISTPSLYFDFRDRHGVREDSPLPAPVNNYAVTKAVAEQLVQASGLAERVILRPRALFGPWDNTLLPRLMRVMQRGMFPLPRGGQALLDITYIDNAVQAVERALLQPLPRVGAVYNVSNGEPMSLEQLLLMLQAELQLPVRLRRVPWPLLHAAACVVEMAARAGRWVEPPLTRYSAGTLAFGQTLDLSAIRADLGYAPLVTVGEGVRRYARWLQEQSHGG